MTSERLRRYWLGELTEDEAAIVKNRIDNSEETREEAEAEENSLVDEWAAGSMPDRERERFERYYLTTEERRTNAAFTRALIRKARGARRRRIAVLAGFVLSTTAAVTLWWTRPHSDPIPQFVLEEANRGPVRPVSFQGQAAILITIPLDRPPGTVRVEMRPAGEPALAMTLSAHRKAQRDPVPVALAAGSLPSGEYTVTVRGAEWADEFVLRLEDSQEPSKK